MPQPAEARRPRPAAEDSFFELLAETLENVEQSARGQFLQKFFKTIAQLDLTEELSLECWEEILSRRNELSESLHKRISIKTAMVDVLASSDHLRVPILVEYDELKKLQSNASTDPLTGLYNRRLFEEYCEKELNRARRYGHHLALVILDLHRLKEVNDLYGHLKGDQALQLAAVTLRKTIRASDFPFRIGGDEFALLLPQGDPEQANTLCRRLRDNYESAVKELKIEIPVTIDFGIAVHPQDGEHKETLVRLADERLYQLKHSTRTGQRDAGGSAVMPPFAVPEEPAARVIAPPTPPVPEAPAAPLEPVSAPKPTPEPHTGPEQRKWERVSLTGTRAYAVLGGGRTAPVLDLSYGGVALQMDPPDELPGQFQAVLHVPILPPVRVSLRKVYSKTKAGDGVRVGCAFVS